MVKIYTFLIFIFLLFTSPILVSAANLSVSPARGTFEVGDKVTVQVIVSSDTPINAVSGIVSFPNSIFSIDSISKAGSILNFWVSEPSFSQSAGTFQFEGVTLGGFAGGGTKNVVTATLRAVKPGSGVIAFKSGQILANDGQGTDVTNNLISATLTVEPKKEVPKIDSIDKTEKVEEKAKAPTLIEHPELPKAEPTLQSPEIVLTRKFGEKAISGTSGYPRSQVLLTFLAQDGVKVFIIGNTNDMGEFLLLVPGTLKQGTYKVSAIVIQENINYSHESNEIEIKVGTIISDTSVELLVILLMLFIIFIYLIIRYHSYYKKNKKLKAQIRKETKKAEDTIHKSFEILNKDISSVSTRKNNIADKALIKELKKDLDNAEDNISKEIKDIEKF